MTTVSYDYQPGTEVYVINTLGPNGQYPYWGFPYIGAGYENFYSPGPIGYPTSYPNGFSATTPAIMSGQVLQTRILMSQQIASPIVMYDVRITSQLGTVSFPANMVFPSTAGTSGSQEVNYNGQLLYTTAISLTTTNTATIYVNGTPYSISVDMTTITSIASALAAVNAVLGANATATLVNGNILITSTTVGSNSSIVINDVNFFSSLYTSFVGINQPKPGSPSGLDQATAYYETLVKS